MIKTIRHANKKITFDTAFGEQRVVDLCSHIEDYMAKPQRVLKDDVTSTVVVIKVDNNNEWVVKRANTKSMLHACRRAFQTSRAHHNWVNARRLQHSQIHSVVPIAMVEERRAFLKGRSYFICPLIKGVDALHYFACGALPSADWPIVCQNICDMISKLEHHRLSHRDLNLSNIIIQNKQPFLIDLDAMRIYRNPWLAKRAAKKEKLRFMENWQEAPKVHHIVEALFFKQLFKEQIT